MYNKGNTIFLIDEVKEHIVKDGREEAESWNIVYDMFLEGGDNEEDGEIEIVDFISPEDVVALTYGVRQARTSTDLSITVDASRLPLGDVISTWKQVDGVMRWTKPSISREGWLEVVKGVMKEKDPLTLKFEDTRPAVFNLGGELSYGYVSCITFNLGTIVAGLRICCSTSEKALVLPKGYRKRLAERLGCELSRSFHDAFNKAVVELEALGYELN